MEFTYKGKPIMPTKTAMNELSEINLNLYEVPEILEKGFQPRKRGKILLREQLKNEIK